MARIEAVIVDLDGTLSNCEHRLHHVTGEKKNWEAFFEGILDDALNRWCARLCSAFQKEGMTIIFLTGRPMRYFEPTVSWLNAHGINLLQSVLFMRKDGDHRQDVIVKREIYESMIAPTYDVQLVIEDRKPVVEMWREMGLPCLHCAGDGVGL